VEVTDRFFKYMSEHLNKVAETQGENIEKAAKLAVESCIKGGKLFIIGTGHSHIMAEELYVRAGGLALVNAILEPDLMIHEIPGKSTELERLYGYGKALLKLHKFNANDTIIVVSNSGRNPLPVEVCIEAKKIGANVIALTSMAHSKSVSSRHENNLKMYEIADVTIDNCGEIGDASFYIEGFENPIGPTSNFCGIAIVQAIIANIVDIMVSAGVKPPVFRSSNLDGCDEYNAILFDKYYPVNR
jgi:uncharacterized phosphosugar-binding protein